MKRCPKCGITKPHSGFYRSGTGLTGWCKECKKLYLRAYNYARFGPVPSEGDVCAICGGTGTPGRRLSRDHDHRCCPKLKGSCGNCFRGFLCGECNQGLGKFKDDPALLRAAADYLSR